MSLVERFGRLAAWGGVSWFVPLVVTFAAIPVLLHSLGQAKLGLLLIFAVTPTVAAQLDVGLTSILIRRLSPLVAAGRIALRPTVSTFALSYTAVGAFFALMMALFAKELASLIRAETVIGSDAAEACVLLCAVWLLVSAIGTIPGVIARACQRMHAVALAQVATAIAFWGGALLLASLHSSLQSFIVLGTAVTTAAGIALWWAVRDRMHSAGGSLFDMSLIKADAGSSSWFFLGQICSIGVFQLDRAAVSMLVGPAAAGAYSVAASVSNKLLASSSSLLTFLMPYAAASGIDDRAELGRLVCQSERMLALLLLPTVIPVWLGADAITHLWLGAAAAPEVAAALKLLWTAFTIPAITAPTGNAFLALGSPAVAAAFSVLTLASFLTLLWLLGAEHGILGAGLAFLVSMSFSMLFHAVARHKLRLVADKGGLAFQGSLTLGLVIQGVAGLAFALSSQANGHMPALIGAAVVWLSFYLGRALAGSTTTMERNLLHRILSLGARRGP